MMGLRRRRGLTSVLLLFVGGWLATPCAAGVQAGARGTPDLEAYQAAASDLLKEIDMPGGAARLPSTKDPKFARFRDQAVALTAALGTDAMPMHLPMMETTCDPAIRVGAAYYLDGASHLPKNAKPAEQQRALQQLILANMGRYFDQLLPIMLFSIHCQAAVLPEMREFVRALPPEEMTETRLTGMRQMRGGFVDGVSGLVMIVSDPQLDEPRRSRVLKLLVRDGPIFISTLPLDVRQRLAVAMAGLQARLKGEAKALAAAFAVQLRSKVCDSVCSAPVLVPSR